MNTAEIGDYVICHINETDSEEQPYTDEFLKNNIGQLISIDDTYQNSQGWSVKFKKAPKHSSSESELYKSFDFKTKVCYFRSEENKYLLSCAFYDDEIIYWAKTKEDVELMRSANKYNV